jgi:hypothetical protein
MVATEDSEAVLFKRFFYEIRVKVKVKRGLGMGLGLVSEWSMVWNRVI